MAQNITASGNVTVESGPAKKVLIQVNKALTGTIVVKDGSTTVATITDPVVGSRYEYWNFATNVQVNPSATTDITVSVTSANR